MSSSAAGKGDSLRKGADLARYRAGYDQISWTDSLADSSADSLAEPSAEGCSPEAELVSYVKRLHAEVMQAELDRLEAKGG